MTEDRKGELLVFSNSLMGAFFPIVAILLMFHIPPVLSAGIGTGFAALALLPFVFFQSGWRNLLRFSMVKDALIATSIITVAMYALYFIGMHHTTAGSASIFALFEILFSFLVMKFWGKEQFSKEAVFGASLMLSGAVVILFQKGFLASEWGNYLIILAMFLCPFGNYFQQKARRKISAIQMVFIRSLLGAPVLCGISWFFEDWETVSFSLPLFGSFFIFGSLFFAVQKVLWVEAIHRIPLTKAITLGTLSPAFTLIFAYFILSEVPSLWQILGFIPMLLGAWFIILKKNIFKILH